MCIEEIQRNRGERPCAGTPAWPQRHVACQICTERRPGLPSDGRKRACSRGDPYEKAGERATAAEAWIHAGEPPKMDFS